MTDHSRRHGTLEEVVRLPESARADLLVIEKPSFEEEQIERLPANRHLRHKDRVELRRAARGTRGGK